MTEHKGSAPQLRAQPERTRRRMPVLCSKSDASIKKKKNKPRGENPPLRRYRHANKSNVAKTLIFKVAAAESPGTQRSRSSPRRCLPAAPGEQQAHPGLALSAKLREDGEHQITRMIGYFESTLPYQPSSRPRVATSLPAPASTGTGRSLGRPAGRRKKKAFPPCSHLRNYPCILPEASAPLLFLGFSTFPPCSVTSVLRERHRVTHFTH